ncbi:helix-turn-helix transcriptional regulator [Streptomyces sp. NPDC051940]|uniref:helix-turn-helix transcriptional regulator n=1 Tax=Streptomyces sp. NPDC051940 TaxID=3155675 RepID=UPI0034306842
MSDRAGSELGRFLRARRALVKPQDVGLPPGAGIRRTPGLRREELATLAGVSIDYYTRLEQGKETRPSPAVIDALARTLQLCDDAYDHLVALATREARHAAHQPAPRTVRAGVRQLLETLRPYPAYVIGRTNDLLAANPAGLRLMAGIQEWPAARRNVLRYMFLHPAARCLYADWEGAVRSGVAHLRARAGTDPDDPELVRLVGELAVKSPEFARLWERYEVGALSDGVKRFRHPEVGDMALQYEVMSLARTNGQRLVAYQAVPGSPDHDAVVLLDLAASAAEAERATR